MGPESIVVASCDVGSTGQQQQYEGYILSPSSLMEWGVQTLDGIHTGT